MPPQCPHEDRRQPKWKTSAPNSVFPRRELNGQVKAESVNTSKGNAGTPSPQVPLCDRPLTPYPRDSFLDDDQPSSANEEPTDEEDEPRVQAHRSVLNQDHNNYSREAASPLRKQDDERRQVQSKSSTFSQVSLSSDHPLHAIPEAERRDYWDRLSNYKSTSASSGVSSLPNARQGLTSMNTSRHSIALRAYSRIPLLPGSQFTSIANPVTYRKLKVQGRDIAKKVADVMLCGKILNTKASQESVEHTTSTPIKTQRKYSTLPSRRAPRDSTSRNRFYIHEAGRNAVRRNSLLLSIPSPGSHVQGSHASTSSRDASDSAQVLPATHRIPGRHVQQRAQQHPLRHDPPSPQKNRPVHTTDIVAVQNDARLHDTSSQSHSPPMSFSQKSSPFMAPTRLSHTIRRAPDSLRSISTISLQLNSTKRSQRQALFPSPSISSLEVKLRDTQLEDIEKLTPGAIWHIRGLLNELEGNANVTHQWSYGVLDEHRRRDMMGSTVPTGVHGGSARDMIQAARTQTPMETEMMVKKRLESINGEVERQVIEQRRERDGLPKDKKPVKHVSWIDEMEQAESSTKPIDHQIAVFADENIVGNAVTSDTVEYQTYIRTPPTDPPVQRSQPLHHITDAIYASAPTTDSTSTEVIPHEHIIGVPHTSDTVRYETYTSIPQTEAATQGSTHNSRTLSSSPISILQPPTIIHPPSLPDLPSAPRISSPLQLPRSRSVEETSTTPDLFYVDEPLYDADSTIDRRRKKGKWRMGK